MKAAIALVLLLALGVGAYFVLAGAGVDINRSSSHPLGQVSAIRALLAEKDLDEATVEFDSLRIDLRDQIGDVAGASVVELRERVADGYKHCIWVVTDSSGKVVCVAGQMRSGSRVYSDVGKRAETFLAKYWVTVLGAKPNFEKKMRDGGNVHDYLEATASRGGVRGLWEKDAGAGGLELVHQIVDLVVLTAN